MKKGAKSNNPNNRINLTKAWKKGESGNPNGRPRKLFTDLAREYTAQGYKPIKAREIADAYEILIALPQDQLLKILSDKEQPILFKIVIKSLIGSRGLEAVETILDRVHGKPKQVNEIGGVNGGSPITVNIIRPPK